MMLKALKKIRYPSSRSGVEYDVGQTFEALSERDANILLAVKLVEQVPSRAARKTLALKAAQPISDQADAQTTETTGTYSRRDMRAED